ncbi:MAG: hypothetical protein Kow0060_17520 [Methylohalobius crimeensis]
MSTAGLAETFRDSRRTGGNFDFLGAERQQKYDLLSHLLTNLHKPLFLCGPDGIGKSTFLRQLHDHPPEEGVVCLIQDASALNMEGVHQALAEALNLRGSGDLKIGGVETALRRHLETLSHRDESRRYVREIVILALDDAGLALPGLLEALCRFAAEFPALRLVAALRPDDLHVKAVTDAWVVEEAHIIELPSLTEKQCADYLGRLWTRLGRSGAPDDAMVREVYRRSHGIPVRVREEMVNLVGKPPLRWHCALAKPVYLALALVVAAVVALTYWQQSHTPAGEMHAMSEDPDLKSGPENGGIQTPTELPSTIVSEGQTAAPGVEQEWETPLDAPSSAAVDNLAELLPLPGIPTSFPKLAVTPETPVQPPPAEMPTAAEPRRSELQLAKEAAVSAPTKPEQPADAPAGFGALGVRDRQWLMRQNPSHYTLQIAAFETLVDLKDLVERYPQLRPLAFYHKLRRGKDWYSLLYGVYPSLAAARRAGEKLPSGLGKPWLRRMRSVHQEIQTAQSQ